MKNVAKAYLDDQIVQLLAGQISQGLQYQPVCRCCVTDQGYRY